MLRRVGLVRTDVSEEVSASFIRVTLIGELGTTLAVTSNRRTLRRNTNGRFLQEPYGVTSQKTPFFIVTAVKTSNLIYTNFGDTKVNGHYIYGYANRKVNTAVTVDGIVLTI
jgi:hypothetical protein